jgi:hypothetical protein
MPRSDQSGGPWESGRRDRPIWRALLSQMAFVTELCRACLLTRALMTRAAWPRAADGV